MKKNFVFDTNVLLDDPNAILKFEDNNVVIPITVIEELDKFKRDLSTVGRNAREITRLIDRYRKEGNLSKGVPLGNGGKLRVVTNLGKEPPLPFPTLGKTADSLILATALMLRKREELPVVFVTRDANLRLRADAVGLTAVNYEEREVMLAGPEKTYTGVAEIDTPSEVIDEFTEQGFLTTDESDLLPNQCVVLKAPDDPERFALGRFHAAKRMILAIVGEDEDMWGIVARNTEQAFAIDLLLDDSIKIVTLSGKAGTGKTLLAIAAGMRKVIDEKAYMKLVVARPIMPLGKELGFLPGQLGEKLKPWMEPVFDNLELISTENTKKRKARRDPSRARNKKQDKSKKTKPVSIKDLTDSGVLDVQALTYIRGRSLPRQFLVIDEAQNLTHHEVKTIVTRVGQGAKIVMTGDPDQIDNPFLDAKTNGLSVATERFKGQELAGHITLEKGERSELAELASNLL